MNLLSLRAEVLAHGFDQNLFASRILDYLNNALFDICRRVDFYTDEAVQDLTTVAGTASYSLPTDFAKARSLRDTNRAQELQAVTLRDIDRSPASNGAPNFYAFDGATLHLYPTPDGGYPLEFRYWKLPTALVGDTDTPGLPADYHNLLWMSAVAECYAAEDDPQIAQYWQQRYEKALSHFATDQKFPNSDMATQAKGMWDRDQPLGLPGWGAWF